MQNILTGTNNAESDIDVIRTRTSLTGTKATSQTDLLIAILTERRHELNTEWRHRWFDLSRTKSIEKVITFGIAK